MLNPSAFGKVICEGQELLETRERNERNHGHTNYYEQVGRGLMHVKRHAFQNCHDVYWEYNWNKQIFARDKRKTKSSYSAYISATMGDNLDDQITNAKVFSCHC